MLRLCRGSSAVEVVGGSTPSFDQLPDLPQATDDRRGRDLHKQVSQVQFPVNAPREIATINLECIDEQEEQRMDPVPEDEESQAPARPSTGGSSRDGGGAGAERRGFVRVRSIRQPPGELCIR